jgi:hypothetical protein
MASCGPVVQPASPGWNQLFEKADGIGLQDAILPHIN